MQRLGVDRDPQRVTSWSTPVRAPGSIQLDERRVAVISLRTEAHSSTTVENVTTGTMVREGQPLMRLYSPLIATAATDYLALIGFKSDAKSLRGAKQRLLNLAASAIAYGRYRAQPRGPADLHLDGTARRYRARTPRRSGHAGDAGRGALPDRGSLLGVGHGRCSRARSRRRRRGPIGDGARAQLSGQTFVGKVALVYPHLNPSTRTVPVRIELPNHDMLLLPDMYVEAEIETGGKPVLAVPEDAVIDSGDRRLVSSTRAKDASSPARSRSAAAARATSIFATASRKAMSWSPRPPS